MSTVIESDWENTRLKEEIESLRQQLEMAEACLAGDNALIVGLKNDIAEKGAEIERLRNLLLDSLSDVIDAKESMSLLGIQRNTFPEMNKAMCQQLAASQAREQQLVSALENHNGNYKLTKAECAKINSVISQSEKQDTTALSALIAKAGEVMRERCLEDIWYMPKPQEIAIRDLPPITLKDLE